MPCIYHQLNLPFVEEEGLAYGSTDLHVPLCNGVVHCSISEDRVESVVNKVIDYFQNKELPHSWWVDVTTEPSNLQETLLNKGYILLGESPGMVLDKKQIVRPIEIESFICEAASNSEPFSQVLAEVFSFQKEDALKCTQMFQPFSYIGKYKGEPVTTGSILVTDKGAYIYNIATLEKWRKRGFGTQMTYFLIQKIANVAQVALIASPESISIYKKLGFKEVSRYHIYICSKENSDD